MSIKSQFLVFSQSWVFWLFRSKVFSYKAKKVSKFGFKVKKCRNCDFWLFQVKDFHCFGVKCVNILVVRGKFRFLAFLVNFSA